MTSNVILGSGVQLETRTVSFPARALAFLIDLAVLVLVMAGIAWLTADILVGLDVAMLQAISIAVVVIAFVVWPTTVETLTRGRSVGKLVTGLRIVRDDGGPVSLRHVLIRHLVGVGELWLTMGVIATLTSFISPQAKRVGDYLAGTTCLRVRFAKSEALNVTMPAALSTWALDVMVRPLPDALLLQIQRFLSRQAQLSPAAAADMSTRLANEARGYVSFVPEGTSAEDFLAALTVLQRDLEVSQVERQQSLEDDYFATVARRPFVD